MSTPAQTGVTSLDFPGLMNNQDPRDLDPGMARLQNNATSDEPGELNVRLGYRALLLESLGGPADQGIAFPNGTTGLTSVGVSVTATVQLPATSHWQAHNTELGGDHTQS